MADTPEYEDNFRILLPYWERVALAKEFFRLKDVGGGATYIRQQRDRMRMDKVGVPIYQDEVATEHLAFLEKFRATKADTVTSPNPDAIPVNVDTVIENDPSTVVHEAVPSKELSREDRITLAVSYYGLYTFGMATTESDRTDENCAMDNMGVPFYEHQLTEKHKEVLARHKSDMGGGTDTVRWQAQMAAIKQRAASIYVTDDPEKKILGTMHHEIPVALDDEGARELSRIMNLRRTAVHRNEHAEVDKQYEVTSWFTTDTGEIDGVPFVISNHATLDAAEKAAEVRIAHLVYSDLVLFQMRQAFRLNKQNPNNDSKQEGNVA